MKPASVTTFTEATFTPGRHAGDADAVERGGDRAGDVRAVGRRGRVPRGLGRVDDAAEAGRALVLGDLRGQVGVRARDAGVEDADDDVRAAGRHGVRLGHVDLGHVPLEAEERLARPDCPSRPAPRRRPCRARRPPRAASRGRRWRRPPRRLRPRRRRRSRRRPSGRRGRRSPCSSRRPCRRRRRPVRLPWQSTGPAARARGRSCPPAQLSAPTRPRRPRAPAIPGRRAPCELSYSSEYPLLLTCGTYVRSRRRRAARRPTTWAPRRGSCGRRAARLRDGSGAGRPASCA